MSLQAALLGEATTADPTRERLLARVRPPVQREFSGRVEGFVANVTLVQFVLGMADHVHEQVLLPLAGVVAPRALEGPLVRVTELVGLQ